MKSEKPSIGVYNDLGTTTLCVKQLVLCLRHVFKSATVTMIDGHDVIANNLENLDLFCVGGGFSRGLSKSMTNIGIQNLRHYVETGGKYLGICSGAYFASRLTHFDVGGPLEVIDEYDLDLFSGIAQGPISANFAYNSEVGSHAVVITADQTDSSHPEKLATYSNGGCEFIIPPKSNMIPLYS